MPSRFLPTRKPRSWLNLLTGPVLTIVAFVIIPYVICIAPGHKLIPLRFLLPLLAIWPNILGGPLEEEFGWRGFLLPRLSARIGNTLATLCVGILWASWHLPMMLARVWDVSFWYYLPLIVALSVFTSLAYFATGRSILGPIIAHYVFNTCSAMLDKALLGQPRYSDRDVNEIVLISMVGVALLTIAATRGGLGFRQA
jgi:membrane protease YdiL (CAAX protease family)